MEYVDDCRYNGQWMNGLVSTYNSSLLLLTIQCICPSNLDTIMGQEKVSLFLVACKSGTWGGKRCPV